MRRNLEQHASLARRLEHEPKLAMLEIPHAAVDESGRTARRAAGEIVALDERDTQSAQCGIASDSRAGDPTADDEYVEDFGAQGVEESRAVGAGGVSGGQIVRWGSDRRLSFFSSAWAGGRSWRMCTRRGSCTART
jgi:hypothetical protein